MTFRLMHLCLLVTIIYNHHVSSQISEIKSEKYWGYHYPFGNRGINYILRDEIAGLTEKVISTQHQKVEMRHIKV